MSRPRTLLSTVLLLVCAAPALAREDLRRNAVTDAVASVGPAVVNISTEQRIRNPFVESLFGRSFAERFNLPHGGYVENSLGSGTIIDPEGHILTNEHVLWRASRITVTLADGRKFQARVVGTDSDSDLSVIRIESEEKLPYVPLGTSADLMIGETVIAIGNPLGLSNTVTVGVLSAAGREVRGGNRTYTDFLQIDAPINPGNSGGPLLNILGEFVGINTSIVAEAEGIGFAIPIDRARVVVQEILEFGSVRPVWLGMDVQAAGGGRAFDAQESQVTVLRSYIGGPADRAGVKPGDILLSVSGQPVRTVADWDTAIRSAQVGRRLPMKLDRGGEILDLKVQAETFPFALAPGIVADLMGMEVAQITPELRRIGITGRGVVVVGVHEGSPAARVGG